MRKRHTAEERERLIAEVKATGEVPRVVAERMGVCASSAYRWLKEASDVRPPVFARVVPSRTELRPSLTVQLGRVTMGIGRPNRVAVGVELVNLPTAAGRKSPAGLP